MSNDTALHLEYGSHRSWHALVLGRTGLDLYPKPDGAKIHDAESFSSDLGGSAGNAALAIAKVGAKAGLISALSDDSVGEFVRQRLRHSGVDISLIIITTGNQHTSLALAEVRNEDCEVWSSIESVPCQP